MTRIVEQKLIGNMITDGISDKTIALFMSYLKNERKGLTYSEYNTVLCELMLCDICGEVNEEIHLTDTFGIINGGLGIICPTCLEDGMG